MSITTLITFFATLTATPGQPSDLCDIVYPDTSRPIFCEPHPDGAPRYNATACCNDTECVTPRAGKCSTGRKAYFCELGEAWSDGVVSCYFEVPEYCDVFPCALGFQTWPQANYMCCHAGNCWNSLPTSNDCEPQDIFWCDNGVTNSDGTVTCFDD